jgi:hypothetical protein
VIAYLFTDGLTVHAEHTRHTPWFHAGAGQPAGALAFGSAFMHVPLTSHQPQLVSATQSTQVVKFWHVGHEPVTQLGPEHAPSNEPLALPTWQLSVFRHLRPAGMRQVHLGGGSAAHHPQLFGGSANWAHWSQAVDSAHMVRLHSNERKRHGGPAHDPSAAPCCVPERQSALVSQKPHDSGEAVQSPQDV